MKLSKGYILGTLEKIADNVKEKFKESAIFGFLCGNSTINDAVSESAVVNMPGYVKNKLSPQCKKTKEKVLAGRAPLKRAQERVGAVDAADLPKNFAYIFGGAVRNSKIIAFINGVWKNLCNTQASLVGALLLLTSISSFAVSLIKHIVKISTDADTFSLYLSIVMFVMAVFLVSAGNKSIHELFTQSLVGSEFMKNVMGVRVIDDNSKEENREMTPSSPRTFVVILFCLIICGASLWAGLERIVAFSLIALFTVAILKMPESGIMMVLMAFPWLELIENGTYVLGAVSLLIIVSWIFKLSVGKRVYNFRFIDAVVGLFLLLYLSAGILGDVSSSNIQNSICYFTIGMVYFPISGLIRSSEWINRCMRAYTFGTLLVSFVCIAKFIIVNLTSDSGFVQGITSVFDNNQSLCVYLLIGIFIGIYNVAEKNENEYGVSFKISLFLNVLCFLLSGSTTAYLAFLIVFLIYLLIQRPKIVVFFLFLIPFALAIWVMMPDVVTNSVNDLIESTDVGLKAKLFVWNGAIDGIKDHLLFGIGTDTTSLKEILGENGIHIPASSQLYNLYINVVVQTGLIGLIVLITCLISAMQRGFFVLSRTEHRTHFRNLSVTAVSALVSLIVFGMGNSLWQDASLLLVFFFVIALVRCVKEIYVREIKADEDGEILDIDISTQRKEIKESRFLVIVLRLVAKIVRTLKKKLKAAKVQKSIEHKNTNDEFEDTNDSSKTVQIQEIDLCEEESSWQIK